MIERAPFGRTGHQSTRIVFGAAALGGMKQPRADATLALVREAGVNHIDTAASYGDSELRLAPFLADHRQEVFLATKTGERTGDAARASLERSLQRLGVDAVDLVQLHNLVEEDEWETAHGPGGAVAALAQARNEGLTRFIGVTGHGLRIPRMHIRSLERFDFDSVLFPFNHALLRQAAYRDDVAELRALCAERNVATQTIKAVAKQRWRDDDPRPHFAWYEPLDDEAAIHRAVGYVLAEPGLFLCSTSDATKLPMVLAAAADPGPRPSDAELDADGTVPLFDGGALERI